MPLSNLQIYIIFLCSILYEEQNISSKNLLYSSLILNSGDYKKLSTVVKSIFRLQCSIFSTCMAFSSPNIYTFLGYIILPDDHIQRHGTVLTFRSQLRIASTIKKFTEKRLYSAAIPDVDQNVSITRPRG